MLHENLKQARMNKGMSQEQLAVRLNVVRQTISKWEKGTSVPDAEALLHLSEVLEMPVTSLLGEAPAPEPAELSDVARQLAHMNELTALKMQREKEWWSKAKQVLLIIALLMFIAAILPYWGDTWHEFGQNLYHLLNPGK
ncbi:MAG: helix-turn-helix domain-containing protein [Clostridia bacterium]|nr:helix-turn-helix domain-containing protein [Clostridia bacterium]